MQKQLGRLPVLFAADLFSVSYSHLGIGFRGTETTVEISISKEALC